MPKRPIFHDPRRSSKGVRPGTRPLTRPGTRPLTRPGTRPLTRPGKVKPSPNFKPSGAVLKKVTEGAICDPWGSTAQGTAPARLPYLSGLGCPPSPYRPHSGTESIIKFGKMVTCGTVIYGRAEISILLGSSSSSSSFRGARLTHNNSTAGYTCRGPGDRYD